ncbi:terminase [Pseudomonas sp. B392_1p]|uniref:terminase n=1 Tax=Pseudomonas sp. B392_1p TaxID=3457507 RepID=UPI003FD54D7B
MHRDGTLTDKKDLIKALGNKWYRLNALYKIKDKNGKVRLFRPNKQQRQRFIEGHCRNVILKARQLGFTTFEMIDALDDCLFTANFAAGCIAHTLIDAQDIFRNKIKFAYDQLRQSAAWGAIFKLINMRLPGTSNDKGDAYVFDNGSSIKVSTSYRGGTLQRLHVSEFGKICRKYPEKAKEIVTGAFEAVGLGNQVTLESTAEGRQGYFFDYCQQAQKLLDSGKEPTEMDWQFHFFPWWDEPGYQLNPAGVSIPSWLYDYFSELEARHGVTLSPAQQAWYAKKAETLKDDMKREYPSTPDEAFAQSVEGAYYMQQMRFLRKNGRITSRVKYNPALPVITAWDLGMSDAMSITFAQVVGREVHVIDYLEHSGEGISYYAEQLRKKGYNYGGHYGPHDLAVRELGTGKSRIETAAQYGIRFEIVPRISNHAEGIEAVRQFLPMCWFAENEAAEEDVVGVDRLVDCLDNYRKDWDERLGVYRETPRHDWASHGAKAFETLARCGLFERATGTVSTPQAPNSARGRRNWNAHT